MRPVDSNHPACIDNDPPDSAARPGTAQFGVRFAELAKALRTPELKLPGWVYDNAGMVDPTGGAPQNASPTETTSVGMSPSDYVKNLGFESALMLVMLDRLQSVERDMQSQVADSLRDSAIKRAYNEKLSNLNTMIAAARDQNPKDDNSSVTFTIDKSQLAVGAYDVKDIDGKPTLVASSAKDANSGITFTDKGDGTVEVTTKVANIQSAIDKVRCSIDSLTTTSEMKSVRLQFLVQTKNSLVSLLTQTMNTEHDTNMAPIKNIRA